MSRSGRRPRAPGDRLAGDQAGGDTRDRSPLRAENPLDWSSDEGRFRATMQVVSGVAVVTLHGRLDRGAIAACRSALETAFRLGTAYLVLDLRRAQVDEESLVVLELLNRVTSHRGVTLLLAGLTVPARGVVRTDRSIAYRVFPTVQQAFDAAVELSHRRY